MYVVSLRIDRQYEKSAARQDDKKCLYMKEAGPSKAGTKTKNLWPKTMKNTTTYDSGHDRNNNSK